MTFFAFISLFAFVLALAAMIYSPIHFLIRRRQRRSGQPVADVAAGRTRAGRIYLAMLFLALVLLFFWGAVEQHMEPESAVAKLFARRGSHLAAGFVLLVVWHAVGLVLKRLGVRLFREPSRTEDQ
jgi:hypothetical protein